MTLVSMAPRGLVLLALSVCVAAWLLAPRGVADISPTAHYTSYVWVRNGLSDPRLQTWQGSCLFYLLEPMMALSRFSGGTTVEQMLLARHRVLDHILTEFGLIIELTR